MSSAGHCLLIRAQKKSTFIVLEVSSCFKAFIFRASFTLDPSCRGEDGGGACCLK